MFGNYSKFVGSIVGGIVGLVFGYLASKGLGTCTAEGVCTILGFSDMQVTSALTVLLSGVFTFAFPANKPT